MALRAPRGKKSAKTKRRKKQSRRLPLRGIALMLVGVSALQFLSSGQISWPGDLYRALGEKIGAYTTRPSAGWRKAGEQLETLGEKREGSTPDFDLQGRVVKIMDGDTLSLLDANNQQHTIRLYGIDTPEWDQPHGKAAKRALAKSVDRRTIGVVTVDTDTFGRTVGTVYRDSRNINLAMVEAGHAWWFTRYAPYERHLEAAEKQARAQRIGLWSEREPTAPWVWRRRH